MCLKVHRPRSTRFLSVASKAAAMALLVRVALGVSAVVGGSGNGEKVVADESHVYAFQPTSRFQQSRIGAIASLPRLPPRSTAPLNPVREFRREAARDRRGRDLHVRQSGRLRPNEYEANARLLDDRSRRLHDHGRRGGGAAHGHQHGLGAREAVAALVPLPARCMSS